MNSRALGLIVVVRVFFLACLLSQSAWCNVGGSISGEVVDPHNLAMAGSRPVVNSASQLRNSTRTNSAGIYLFPDLLVGIYDIAVEAKGFRTYRRTRLMVDVNSSQQVDIPLEIGDLSETVTAAQTRVETSDTQIGEVVSGSTITAVPLNGRSFTDLLALQPGVAPSQRVEISSPSKEPNYHSRDPRSFRGAADGRSHRADQGR